MEIKFKLVFELSNIMAGIPQKINMVIISFSYLLWRSNWQNVRKIDSSTVAMISLIFSGNYS